MVTIGVISDTHIPDRARQLNNRALEVFQQAGVLAILHAGDISSPGVLVQLGEIAPVFAVRGNRDWIWLRHLPLARTLEFDHVTIGLTHGHGRWWNYLYDRLYILFNGYHHGLLQPRLLQAFPDVQVIVFGHAHRPFNQWVNGQLLFNPGSPHFPDTEAFTPSVGLLQITSGREIKSEIVDLA